MILGEHEAAQFRSKMPGDAGRQWRCHGCAVRRLPALATEIHDMRTDHQVLHHKIRVPFEARPLRRSCDLDGPLLMDRQLRRLAALRRVSPPAVRGVFGSVALVHPAGFDVRPPRPAFEAGDLVALRCNRSPAARPLLQTASAPSSSNHPAKNHQGSAGGTIPTRNLTRASLGIL